MKSVHEGHRARLRRAFLSGAELEDHELLELLLTYAIPRADVNPLAHHLLDRFGGLEKVFQASPEELKELAGVGESAAVLIKSCRHCKSGCWFGTIRQGAGGGCFFL